MPLNTTDHREPTCNIDQEPVTSKWKRTRLCIGISLVILSALVAMSVFKTEQKRSAVYVLNFKTGMGDEDKDAERRQALGSAISAAAIPLIIGVVLIVVARRSKSSKTIQSR